MSEFMIPNRIISFLRYLESKGFQAYLVGGCVRDGLLKLTPHDWDVCTDAVPQELQALFPDSLTYGMRHGTVTVKWQELMIEVTTFRAESTYTDHRRPDHVSYIQDLKSDLARRDFTVNAIAMDADRTIHDPFGGMLDLKAGVIRAVGSAEERFQEDALRMLRAVRFSAQLQFSIEPITKAAIWTCAPLTAALSSERVAQEMEKTLMTSQPERISDMLSAGLLIPWIAKSANGSYDKLKNLKPNRIHRWCGLSLLLHSTEFLKRLRLDRKTTDICTACCEIGQNQNRDDIFWKWTVYHYGKETAKLVSEVLSAWNRTDDDQILQSILDSGACCTVSELAIRGNDLMTLGFQGKEIGAALEKALRHVWSYPEHNDRELLLSYLREEDQHG